jgi:hypothetical protein
MKYTDYYKHLINEGPVPFKSRDIVKKGLVGKYGSKELDSYKFGIELEFVYDNGDIEYDWSSVKNDMYENREAKTNAKLELENDREHVRKYWDGDLSHWNDKFGPIDVETFKSKNPEPEGDANEKSNWNKIISSIDDIYESWERFERDDLIYKYIDEMDPFIYLDMSNYILPNADGVSAAKNYITKDMHEKVNRETSTETEWNVGYDGNNIEIRSKHLNQNEFNLVDSICKFVADQSTSGKMSAHVHVGLPSDFDAYDLLAMTTLVDEDAIKMVAGKDRSFSKFSKLRDNLHAAIFSSITYKSEFSYNVTYMSNEQLKNLLKFLDRNHGTNVSSILFRNTVEFRYLSSNIASDSNTFIEWIKYFLLLPKIAKSRNTILIQGVYEPLTVIRETGRVKFVLGRKSSTLNLPAGEIKNIPFSKFQLAMQKKDQELAKKFSRRSQ